MSDGTKQRLLLISNSYCHGKTYFEHCMGAVLGMLGPKRCLAFVPYALKDEEAYLTRVRAAFGLHGVTVISIAEFSSRNRNTSLEEIDGVLVGGGNTFRLLKALEDRTLLGELQGIVRSGKAYIGVNAGANIACPTIMTTNDMPIVQPRSFEGLGLVPFQINPHYFEPEPGSKHMGETRAARIKEFHEENKAMVVGLREGAWIRVEYGAAQLDGTTGAKIFERDKEPREWVVGEELSVP